MENVQNDHEHRPMWSVYAIIHILAQQAAHFYYIIEPDWTFAEHDLAILNFSGIVSVIMLMKRSPLEKYKRKVQANQQYTFIQKRKSTTGFV